jgi:hypothetical protein
MDKALSWLSLQNSKEKMVRPLITIFHSSTDEKKIIKTVGAQIVSTDEDKTRLW